MDMLNLYDHLILDDARQRGGVHSIRQYPNRKSRPDQVDEHIRAHLERNLLIPAGEPLHINHVHDVEHRDGSRVLYIDYGNRRDFYVVQIADPITY